MQPFIVLVPFLQGGEASKVMGDLSSRLAVYNIISPLIRFTIYIHGYELVKLNQTKLFAISSAPAFVL